MITVVSAEWRNYLGRADEYIDKLRAGVARHLRAAHRFECLRLDDSPLTGWFRKLEVFRPGRFKGRVLYLDLDSVVVGPLDPLVYRKGAVHLAHWGWSRNIHFGGVWVFDAENEGRAIWNEWRPEVAAEFENDQDWITTLRVFDPLPKGLVVSYRYHCRNRLPGGASVVAFHGKPKPHEVADPWVRENWCAE